MRKLATTGDTAFWQLEYEDVDVKGEKEENKLWGLIRRKNEERE